MCEQVSHPDQCEDIIHVWPDVDLDEAYNHTHLLEKKLKKKRDENKRKMHRKRDDRRGTTKKNQMAVHET